MKRKLLISLLLLAAIVSSKNTEAQNQVYWRESFTASGTGVSDPGAAATVFSYTGDAGVWSFYGLWTTTGTDCPTTGQGAGTNRHIRSTNALVGAGTPALDDDDTCFAITPSVGFGIQELHLYRSRSNRRTTIWKTADTDINTTNWVVASVIPKSTATAVCADTTILISDATAKRLRFRFERATNTDIDSVFITSVSAILPVRYTSFSGIEAGGKIKLSWGIATEVNTSKYVIERSANGRNFIETGLLNASRSSTYNWIDNAPAAGTNYYRIKAVDKDGSAQYTGVVKITIGKKGNEFTVSPNPVQGGILNLQLVNFEKAVYTVNVVNNLGQKIYAAVIDHAGGSTSKLLQLPAGTKPGIYNLQLLNSEKVMTKSIVVE